MAAGAVGTVRAIGRSPRRSARGWRTLLIDLLTVEEERDRAYVFDIVLLAERLASALRAGRASSPTTRALHSATSAPARAPRPHWGPQTSGDGVSAVVSRGGWPDLAAPRLPEVRAATLLIVGGLDTVVIQLNREALAALRCQAHLEIVPGATHLFEEAGTLEAVQRLAADWFTQHLAAEPAGPEFAAG